MLEEKQAGPQKKPARADPISSPSPPLSPPASIALDPLETPEAWNLPDTDAVLLAPYHALLDRVGSYPIQDAHVLSAFQREVLRARNANPSIFLMSWRMELWSSLPGGEPLSLPRLASAWRATVSRFPVLRSVFLKEAPAQLGLPVVQVVLGPEAASEAGILMSEAPSEAPEPVFDDSVLPGVDSSFLPHRAHIIRHGQRVYLHVEMDHLIIDGWSLGLIKKALLEAYDEPDIRQESVTPSYQAFVAAQSTTERIRADNAYWTRLLQGLSPSRLSTTLGSARSAAGPLVRQKKAIVRLPGLRLQVSCRSVLPTASPRHPSSLLRGRRRFPALPARETSLLSTSSVAATKSWIPQAIALLSGSWWAAASTFSCTGSRWIPARTSPAWLQISRRRATRVRVVALPTCAR